MRVILLETKPRIPTKELVLQAYSSKYYADREKYKKLAEERLKVILKQNKIVITKMRFYNADFDVTTKYKFEIRLWFEFPYNIGTKDIMFIEKLIGYRCNDFIIVPGTKSDPEAMIMLFFN